jgi:mycofactocin precursor
VVLQIAEVRLTTAELEVDAEFVLAVPEEPLVDADLLIEDISIDGMCGVY